MTSFYLRCDVCEKPENDFTIHEWNRGGGQQTKEAAKQVGWQITSHDKHVCPSCLALEALVRGAK